MNTVPFILKTLLVFVGLVLFSRTQKANLFWTQAQKLKDSLNRDWWIKIKTDSPLCTYYFGPFDTKKEAKCCQEGYLEDLENEGALGISSQIQWVQPETLTLEESY